MLLYAVMCNKCLSKFNKTPNHNLYIIYYIFVNAYCYTCTSRIYRYLRTILFQPDILCKMGLSESVCTNSRWLL